MTDGRNYADWQPNAVVNNQIIKDVGIKSNQYRKYLMENADSIIKLNQVEACNQCCTCPAVYGNHQQIPNTLSCINHVQILHSHMVMKIVILKTYI